MKSTALNSNRDPLQAPGSSCDQPKTPHSDPETERPIRPAECTAISTEAASARRRWWVLNHSILLGAAAAQYMLEDTQELLVREISIVNDLGAGAEKRIAKFFIWNAWAPFLVLVVLAAIFISPRIRKWYATSGRWGWLPLAAVGLGFSPALGQLFFTGCFHAFLPYALGKILILAWFYQRIISFVTPANEEAASSAHPAARAEAGGCGIKDSVLLFWLPSALALLWMGWGRTAGAETLWKGIVSPLTIAFASQAFFIMRNRERLQRPAWAVAYSIMAAIWALWPEHLVIRGRLDHQFANGFGWLWSPAALASLAPGVISAHHFGPSASGLEFLNSIADTSNGVTRHFYRMLAAGSLTACALFPFLTAMLIALAVNSRKWRLALVAAAAPIWAACLLCPQMPSPWNCTEWMSKGAIWNQFWLIRSAIILLWLGLLAVCAFPAKAHKSADHRVLPRGAGFYVRGAIAYMLISAVFSILFAFSAALHLDRRARRDFQRPNPMVGGKLLKSLNGPGEKMFFPSEKLQNNFSFGDTPEIRSFFLDEAQKHEFRWKIIVQTALEADKLNPLEVQPQFRQIAGIIGHLMGRIAIYKAEDGKIAESIELTTQSLHVINLSTKQGWDEYYHIDAMSAICRGKIADFIKRADTTSSTLVARDILERLNRGLESSESLLSNRCNSDFIYSYLARVPPGSLGWPARLFFAEDFARRWENNMYWFVQRFQNDAVEAYWRRIQIRLRLYIARTGELPGGWDEVERVLGKDILSQPSAIFFRPPSQYIIMQKRTSSNMNITWNPQIAPPWRSLGSPARFTETHKRIRP